MSWIEGSILALTAALGLAVLYLLARLRAETHAAAAEQTRLRDELARVHAKLDALGPSVDRIERAVREEIARNREETQASSAKLREELGAASARQREEATQAAARLRAEVTASSEALRKVVDVQLKFMQEDNAKKLELIRATVDEKLQGTLEKRLGESFKLVSERLEQVHKGLGEMQTLANGVGDLKRVLTNVKTRGTWGEIQLAALLEQVLTPQQYAANVATVTGSAERVEFAIRLPGQDGAAGPEGCVWLPIDAKFPQEDYQRLLEAQDRADPEAAELAGRAVEARIKASAKDIRDKYLGPPATTDFGIMFLPTEGLYAEVLRRPGLIELLQREYRVVITGPTTLAALLNSLRMGFRTLAISKRSDEVWQLLGAVKGEFGKFGDVLSAVKKKLEEASGKIGDAEVRTRAIERKLRGVEELPSGDAQALLGGARTLEPADGAGNGGG